MASVPRLVGRFSAWLGGPGPSSYGVLVAWRLWHWWLPSSGPWRGAHPIPASWHRTRLRPSHGRSNPQNRRRLPGVPLTRLFPCPPRPPRQHLLTLHRHRRRWRHRRSQPAPPPYHPSWLLGEHRFPRWWRPNTQPPHGVTAWLRAPHRAVSLSRRLTPSACLLQPLRPPPARRLRPIRSPASRPSRRLTPRRTISGRRPLRRIRRSWPRRLAPAPRHRGRRELQVAALLGLPPPKRRQRSYLAEPVPPLAS